MNKIALSPLRGGPTGRHDKQDGFFCSRFASLLRKKKWSFRTTSRSERGKIHPVYHVLLSSKRCV